MIKMYSKAADTKGHQMRKNYIDWLRNLGILYLFPFHTARLFDSLEPNYIKDPRSLRSRFIRAQSYRVLLLKLDIFLSYC